MIQENIQRCSRTAIPFHASTRILACKAEPFMRRLRSVPVLIRQLNKEKKTNARSFDFCSKPLAADNYTIIFALVCRAYVPAVSGVL